MPRRLLFVTISVLAVLSTAFAAPAAAADTTIGFDDQPSGTILGTQYASQGVTFGVEAPNAGRRAGTPIVFAAGYAHSQPNVLGLQCGEVCDTDQWVGFSTLPTHVSLYVASTTTGSFPVTMVAYDQNGSQIASTSGQANPESFSTQLSLSAPTGTEIGWIDLQTSPDNPYYVVDDLTFGSAGPPTPDFGLVPDGGGVTVLAGATATVNVTLHRYNGSTGRIALQYTGGPSGVTVTGPAETTAGDGATIPVTVTADASAPGAVGVPATVTGTPGPKAGPQPHSVSIPISVTGNFDLRVQGLYVTQGIQPDAGGLVPSGENMSGQTYTHNGWVHLVAGKKTVVRMYADAFGAPPSGIPGVQAVLHAFAGGKELPGSPIFPDYGPASLTSTNESFPEPVLDSELESDKNAYTFTLPDAWATGTIQLVGDVLAPALQSFGGPQYIECQSTACQSNDSFTLNDVQFNPTRSFTLQTVALAVPGQPTPVPASQAFAYAKAVTPLGDEAFTVLPYATTIDTSKCVSSGFTCVSGSPLFDVSIWDFSDGYQYDGVEGIGSGGFGGVTACDGCRDSATTYNPAASSGNQRPLSSVAHELFHQFGLPHASNECGGGGDNDSDDHGQTGEPWSPAVVTPTEPKDNPPDDGIGQLDGLALDTTSEPYTFRGDPLSNSPHMDFMSYCNVFGNANDANMWVSPRNWEAVYSHFAQPGAAADIAAAASRRLRALAKLDPTHLRVVAITTAKLGTRIVSVGPQVGPRPPATAHQFRSSTFTLSATGSALRKARRFPLAMDAAHIDGLTGFAVLTAVVPAAGVDGVQITSGGKVLASRTRPRRPPTVRVLAPKGGARVGGRAPTVAVRWHAGNPQHLKLKATIDYSTDGGASWRTIFIGPSTGRAILPSYYFTDSRKAQVRVRVNDGFNETVATSGTFTALGSRPTVSILTPTGGTTFAADATIPLAGQAFDDALAPLTGNRLTWTYAGAVIGHGASTSVAGLPVGTDLITLTARDGHRRAAHASVTVNVTPVSIRFLDVHVPTSVATTATQLQLTARSTVAATLTIGARQVPIGPRRRSVAISIREGNAPVLVRLSVSALGATYPLAYLVGRSPNLPPNPPHPPPCGLECV